MNTSKAKSPRQGRIFKGISISLHPSQVERLKEIERVTGVKPSTTVQRALDKHFGSMAPIR